MLGGHNVKITDHLISAERVLWQGKGANGTEYLITNQRVLICSSKNCRNPKIINLYKINGQIEMKYDKHSGTGSIWIPTPHWNRFVTPGRIYPDIWEIIEPVKAYDILIEAIATGKLTK